MIEKQSKYRETCKREDCLKRNTPWHKQCPFILLFAGWQHQQQISIRKGEITDIRQVWCLPCSDLVMTFFPSWSFFQCNVPEISTFKISLENVNSLTSKHVEENKSAGGNTDIFVQEDYTMHIRITKRYIDKNIFLESGDPSSDSVPPKLEQRFQLQPFPSKPSRLSITLDGTFSISTIRAALFCINCINYSLNFGLQHQGLVA